MPIPHTARTEILRRLAAAEREHNVKILYAIESGSRAWGFASPNSDFDARFIYVHRPEWYLSIGLEEQRDVIEYPIVDEMDINGWDVRKALRLLWKSNPSIVEWLHSPIVYQSHTDFAETLRALLPNIYATHSGIYHYKSTAKTTFKDHLQADNVRLKKYFYALRPLLAVRWLERFGTPAPIEFDKLLDMLDEPPLRALIDNLVALKKQTPELGLSPKIPKLNAFIETELQRLNALQPQVVRHEAVLERLDPVFRSVLTQAWA
ncbi:MAG: nucleotidyltransferase domain-containing protein [Formosimonas sp.]